MATETKKRIGRPPKGDHTMSATERSRNHREEKKKRGEATPERAYFVIEGPFVERLDAIIGFYGWNSRAEALRALLSDPLQMNLDTLEKFMAAIETRNLSQEERQRQIEGMRYETTHFYQISKQIRQELDNGEQTTE